MDLARAVRDGLKAVADPERALQLARFLKTGPGGYGEGDRFHGVRVPEARRIAKAHDGATLDEVRALLRSPFHEERMVALFILVRRYQRAAHRGDRGEMSAIFSLYMDERAHVDNWDLVDSSAPYIVGPYLDGEPDRGRPILLDLAASKRVWDRRISVLSSFPQVRSGSFDMLLELAEMLLGDPHDLIHKAVGWMLREMGERDRGILEGFLDRHAHEMPRTMLRYALEKFPDEEKQRFMRRRRGSMQGGVG